MQMEGGKTNPDKDQVGNAQGGIEYTAFSRGRTKGNQGGQRAGPEGTLLQQNGLLRNHQNKTQPTIFDAPQARTGQYIFH